VSSVNSVTCSAAGGQSYCVALWAGHRYREPVLQGAHAMWSLGGMVGPFITASFLVDLPNAVDATTSSLRCTNGTEANNTCTSLGLGKCLVGMACSLYNGKFVM